MQPFLIIFGETVHSAQKEFVVLKFSSHRLVLFLPSFPYYLHLSSSFVRFSPDSTPRSFVKRPEALCVELKRKSVFFYSQLRRWRSWISSTFQHSANNFFRNDKTVTLYGKLKSDFTIVTWPLITNVAISDRRFYISLLGTARRFKFLELIMWLYLPFVTDVLKCAMVTYKKIEIDKTNKKMCLVLNLACSTKLLT